MNGENDSGSETETVKKSITKKDLAKKMRREAYLRAKEYKKTDPRELARKALAKEQRKATYQKAKERSKAMKKTNKEKIDLKDKLVLAIDLEVDDRPLAPVISIDSLRLKQRRPK